MRFRLYIYTLLLGALMSSCVSEDDIRITEVHEVSFDHISRPEIRFAVENNSKRKIQLVEAKLTFYYMGNRMGDMLLVERVVLKKRSVTEVELPVRFKVYDQFTAAAATKDDRLDAENITVSGRAKVKAGAVGKKFTFNDVPLSDIISNFDTVYIEELNL